MWLFRLVGCVVSHIGADAGSAIEVALAEKRNTSFGRMADPNDDASYRGVPRWGAAPQTAEGDHGSWGKRSRSVKDELRVGLAMGAMGGGTNAKSEQNGPRCCCSKKAELVTPALTLTSGTSISIFSSPTDSSRNALGPNLRLALRPPL